MRPPRTTMQPLGQILANATPTSTAAVAADLQRLTAPSPGEELPHLIDGGHTMSSSQQLAAMRFASATDRPEHVVAIEKLDAAVRFASATDRPADIIEIVVDEEELA